MAISLSRMAGMPVIWRDEQIGCVERAVMNEASLCLKGLILRKGLLGARWAAGERIDTIGRWCVILRSPPVRVEERSALRCPQAFLPSGECVGDVTDGLISEDTLRLFALEISRGSIARWLGRGQYARQFRMEGDRVIVPALLSWAQLLGENGEEDGG